MEKQTRKRVEVSTSVKGVHTYSCTVEITGDEVTDAEIVEASTALVRELDELYPPQLVP
jgi:SOS-response transcriptional repressor LexA